jgi:hypothetical protein
MEQTTQKSNHSREEAFENLRKLAGDAGERTRAFIVCEITHTGAFNWQMFEQEANDSLIALFYLNEMMRANKMSRAKPMEQQEGAAQ